MQGLIGGLDRLMEAGIEYTGMDQEIEELIVSMGYGLVEYSARNIRKTLHVHMILFSKSGVSIDDCADVYRTVLPKLEVLYDTRDIHLEVSSPGITRTIKSIKEMKLYTGKGISILNEGNWTGGILKEVSDNVVIETTEGPVSFVAGNIQKAKLDYTQEVIK